MNNLLPEKILIRADGSTEIGTGHLMRCLALAQAWQDCGGTVIFVSAMLPSLMESRLQQEGFNVIRINAYPGSSDDTYQTIAIARQIHVNWIIIDGYQFNAEYQRKIKDIGLNVLCVDDHAHAEHYYADIVLNQNLYAQENLYQSREQYTRLLLGTRYVLLRREFRKWRHWKRDIPEIARKLLVTMGGSDPNNVTLKVLQALQHVAADRMEIMVIVGSSNPHYDTIKSFAHKLSFPTRLEKSVTDISRYMAWADVAISAGGSTSWELAFMELPTLTVAIVDNQLLTAQYLHMAGASFNLGWHRYISVLEMCRRIQEFIVSRDMRFQVSKQSKEIVDGEGSLRTVAYMRGVKMYLRNVRESDCRILWQWANDQTVRENSFSSRLISWEEHLSWFTSKINDDKCVFYMVENDRGIPIAQVRFETTGSDDAIISVSVAEEHRGKGYGHLIINHASRKLLQTTNIKVVHAYIKPNNVSSLRAFERAGYTNVGEVSVSGQQALHLILSRDHKE
ncbi:MAG: UDP-2,4-diacetamido-2,4,6-trideoxy-beta-L-altropyranose hydrolase [Chloroflexus sp.]